MPTKNIAASFVLALLFISLIVIFLVTSQDPRVTSICVTLLAISLFVTIDGGWREIGVVGALGALVSLVAAWLFGRAYFGPIGGAFLTFGWAMVVLAVFRSLSRNIVRAPSDRAVVITNLYTGRSYRAGFPDGEPQPGENGNVQGEPIAPPIFPLLERRVAVVPLYELDQEVRVEKINTQSSSGHNVDAMTVQVRYKITDWVCALDGVPNRGQAHQEVAKQISKSLEEARNDTVFWERLFARQMEADVSDIVREVVFNTGKDPAAIYKERTGSLLSDEQHSTRQLRELVKDQLVKRIERWGATIVSLDIDKFEVDSNRFSSFSPAQKEAKRIELIRMAEAEAEAVRVKRLVETLRESGVEMSDKVLADIVISAIQASHDWGLDNDYDPLLSDSAPANKPVNKTSGAR